MPVPVPPHATRVFKGIKHDIWQWEQKMFDGSVATFEGMVREDTVGIIPFLDAETVLLVREEQPNRDKPFWDVPGGCMDAGETPEQTAARELTEETGYTARALRLFRTKRFLGMTRFEQHVVLAAGLSDGHGTHLDAGERIELHPTPWKDVVRMSLRMELRRMEVMLAILSMEFDPESRKMKDDFLQNL